MLSFTRKSLGIFFPPALLALILSALTPQGFMPSQTANGFSITLCSGHEDSKLAVTPDHPDYALLELVYGNQQPDSEPEPESETAACAFASGSSLGLASHSPTIANNAMAPISHEPDSERRFALRNRINIPPATGPPVIV